MTLPPAPDRWTIELSNAERMEAVAAFGFTERQARFLLNVLLHSGVFVERQYCSFAGIVHGQKSTDFISSLVERRFATPITTGKLHRGRSGGSSAHHTPRHLRDDRTPATPRRDSPSPTRAPASRRFARLAEPETRAITRGVTGDERHNPSVSKRRLGDRHPRRHA
jgi:hypothetical protein